MKAISLRGVLVTVCLMVGASFSKAAIITEIEEDGTAVNNEIGAAQVIDGSAFTVPVPGGVFNPPGYRTATIQGGNGASDVDFYRFFSVGGEIYIDMDNLDPTFDPLVALFDSAGTLIAYADDSDLDDGSTNTVDSFLGVFMLPGSGYYYIGISEFSNLPTTALTGSETPLVRPDGNFGGYAVSGVSAGVSTYDFNDVQPSGASYNLHVSIENTVPEPTSLLLVGSALTLAGFLIARRHQRR